MEYRTLGSTGLSVSVIGFGGIVVAESPQDEANHEVAVAFDAGVRYFDVAPQYHDAQQRLGPALAPFRDQCVLACKTLERTAEGARRELEDSLAKLKTDHVDIYQLHAMTTAEDVDTALGPGGALETFLEAKQKGQVRHIGFSAHNEDAALRLIETGQFETALFPLNFRIFEAGAFGPRLLEAANDRNMGVLALKSMARSRIEPGEDRSYPRCWYHPEDRPEIASLLLRYTLTLPGVAAALPPGDPKLFQMALSLKDQVTHPLSGTDLDHLASTLAEQTPLFANADG